ncbi:MAG TPA: ATP synthase F1 subunit delta [Crinalium sp.]|jgi:F-type H+-transporting ATPase subunit delta
MNNFVSSEIVEPYAQALMSVAQAHDLTDRFGEDTGFVLGLLSESEELRQLLASPLIKSDVKKSVLVRLASETVHPFFLNFLNILVDRGRVLFLDGVCKQYQVLLRKLKGTVLAEVVSTVELNDAQKDAIRRRVTGLVSAQQVDLETRIDPDLIGGVIIKVGSQVIDASLRGQLRRIGLSLSSAT